MSPANRALGRAYHCVAMSIRSIIVDDEVLARERLRQLLAGHADVEITSEFASAEGAREFLEQQTPDVVFLDIQLGDRSGLSIANMTRSLSPPYIIFTTAFSDYAVQAFESRAIDYIVKPVEQGRLSEALDRVRRQMSLQEPAPSRRSDDRAHGRIAVPNDGRFTLVRLGDIDWIESVGNYVKIHTGSKSYIIRSPLYSFIKKLDPVEFVRIHRKYIVNVSRVAEIARGVKRGDYIVRLDDGNSLAMQRAYAADLRSAVGRF